MSDLVFEVIRSSRKTVAVQVKPDLRVVVRAPMRMKNADIDAFVEKNRAWIERHLQAAREAQAQALPPLSNEEIEALADRALAELPPRVAQLASLLGVQYHRITIRNQTSRWGSCSGKKNLNFNCLLMLCPGEVTDYVILHELCHLKELNHSKRFWALVEGCCPNYRAHRRWLRTEGQKIIGRMKHDG